MARSPIKAKVCLAFPVDSCPSRPKSKRAGERGQIAIEYVLILVVAVTIAVTLSKGLVGRDPADPGLIVQSWVNILRTVGQDLADAPAR